jgi:amino acid permease
MRDTRRFLPTLDFTLSIIAVIYVAIGVIGYGLFVNAPGSVHSIIISNLPSSSWYSSVIKIILAATLLFSAPLSLVPSLNILRGVLSLTPASPRINESTKLLAARPSLIHGNGSDTNGHHHDNGDAGSPNTILRLANMRHLQEQNGDDEESGPSTLSPSKYGGVDLMSYALSISSVVLITCIALFVPCFSMVLSMIGSVTITLLCFILPPLFYLILYHMEAISTTLIYRIAAWLFIICGIAVMIGSFSIVSKAHCE